MRTDSLLGIDLGTSSVKVLLRHADGRIEKGKATYDGDGFYGAVRKALRSLDLSSVAAIGLSSQTGTYIVNDKDVIDWRVGEGKRELEEILHGYTAETFIREIAMPHPPLLSYPIPRLLYLKRRFGTLHSVYQPKDLVVRALTGRLVSDPYTWRGLADPHTRRYSAYFLSQLGIDETVLPPLRYPTECAGEVTREAADETGLPIGTPVYLGLNDFFASILGMGITENGMFDITGTSEHLGVVSEHFTKETRLISGPYLENFVHYGVTASSGVSMDFGKDHFGFSTVDPLTDPSEILKRKPPIFLPYLSGERAPIFDGGAKGVFFGIERGCSKEDMAYAVLEGVAFSLYHIYESFGSPADAPFVTVSGGASKSVLLNHLKAELLGKNVVTLKENDTSALGAAMAAGVGLGVFASYTDASEQCTEKDAVYTPCGKYRARLLERYEIYKSLYPSLKDAMHTFDGLSK